MREVIKIETGVDLESAWLSQELAIREEFSTVIINASFDGIITYDKQGRYTLWTPSMEKLTGMKSREVLGKKATELFPFLKEFGIDRLVEDSLLGIASKSVLERYKIPGTGHEGFTRQRNFPLYNEEGKVTGGMAIIRDLTSTQRVFDDLAHTNRELKSRIQQLEAMIVSLQNPPVSQI